MQYDTLFWNIFESSGMTEAYMNYKQFSRIEEIPENKPEDTGI